MWLVRLALSRPYTFVVAALAVLLAGSLQIVGAPGWRAMPKDIFPEIAEPVVTVIWQYVGIPAEAFEKQITLFAEQQISTTVSNIRRIESHTIFSKSLIRLYFQPGVRIDQALAEITATSQTILRRMPPGQTPPQIVQYNASSVPILQIALGSDTLTEQELYDKGLWLVRNNVIQIPGTTVPLPYGGRPRLVMIDADPARMASRGVTVKDINDALLRQNVNLPTGSTQIGSREYILAINNTPEKIDQIGDMPIRTANGAEIFIRDVADVRDGYNEQTSLVRHDGRKSSLLTVLKSGGASTLDIIREVRERIAAVELPEGMQLSFLFDQSVFVVNAMHAVVIEGVIAAGFTGLMVLAFLGNLRSTVIVVVAIPLSVLFAVILLGALGHTLNLMTLGGLALSVGILVDDATVAIENVHRHLAMGEDLRTAILEAAREVAVPAFVAMLCICIVFLPVLLLTGAPRYLFVPMALAVVFAVVASWFVSRTLVPVMSRYLLTEHHFAASAGQRATSIFGRMHGAIESGFARVQRRYERVLDWALTRPAIATIVFAIVVASGAAAIPFVGQDFFPVVDAGQIRLHINAPVGTRIEETGAIFSEVQNEIRRVVAPADLDVIIDNIGVPPSTNLAYSDNVTITSADGEMLVALKAEHGSSTAEYVRRLRELLPKRFPDCGFYFQPGDMMNQILNFGLPAPIDIRILGGDLGNFAMARKIEAAVRAVPGAVDVHVHQIMNQPALKIEVDRTRAHELGISQRDIAENYLISSSSSVVLTPTYWNDPKSGRPYQVVVVQPHHTALDSIDAILGIPLPGRGQSPTIPLGNVATVKRAEVPAIINHVNTELAFDVYANVQGRDLGGVSRDVNTILADFQTAATAQKNNTRIELAGQAQSMADTFVRMGLGMVFATLLVYFVLVVNFQSWTDPLLILAALPGALAGVVWMLFLTGTTFSVPAMLGAIMTIGVATANSILMISFANAELAGGRDARAAAREAGRTRLRPVVMTAFAMIAGMLPMASGLGHGGEQNAPLGRAVVGGLLLATVTTLLFVPVMFAWLRRRGPVKLRFPQDREFA